MEGFSITIFKLVKPNIIEYLNFHCKAPCWYEYTYLPLNTSLDPWLSTKLSKDELKPKTLKGAKIDPILGTAIKNAIVFAGEALISCERQINIMDAELGDADTGFIFLIKYFKVEFC